MYGCSKQHTLPLSHENIVLHTSFYDQIYACIGNNYVYILICVLV